MRVPLPLLQLRFVCISLTTGDFGSYHVYLHFGFAILCIISSYLLLIFMLSCLFSMCKNLLYNTDNSPLSFFVPNSVYYFLSEVVLLVPSLLINRPFLLSWNTISLLHIRVWLSPGVSFWVVCSVPENFLSFPMQTPYGFDCSGFVVCSAIQKGNSLLATYLSCLFFRYLVFHMYSKITFSIKEPYRASHWKCIKFTFGRIKHFVHILMLYLSTCIDTVLCHFVKF